MAPAVFTSCHVEIGGLRFHYSDVLAAGTAQRMLAENPHARMAGVPDCGHSITLDNPMAC